MNEIWPEEKKKKGIIPGTKIKEIYPVRNFSNKIIFCIIGSVLSSNTKGSEFKSCWTQIISDWIIQFSQIKSIYTIDKEITIQ